MANSFIEYTGDGSTTAFSITFNYLATTDVKAFLNGTPTTAFSVNGQTLTFNSAPASQTAILIERDTPKTSRLVDFSDGAILSEADLDKNSNQLFFISQEAVDTADRALGLDNSNQFDATKNNVARRITNLADPVNAQDAVTKNWLTTTYLTPANIVNIDATGTNIANVNTVAGDIANVNSVAGNATNINTVAGNNANINTVAGNNADISTVAGISSQVTTVANASSNIAAVATDIAAVQTVASDLQETVSEIETVANDLNEQTSEIDTVAGAVANINTVGTNINNVNATGGAITNVNAVAGQISPTNNIGTVAGISTEIGNVSGISSAVSSVGGAITNVNAVAGQISPTNNISTVASNISDIQDVGGNIGAITTVNGISANVSTVAGISANVTTVAGNNNNITNVANNNTNITTVAGAATNINTVAANVSNVGTVAGISSDVTTAAGIASNISAVANISSDVSTVASNVTGVNSFADRYRVGSSDPSSSNDAGDLFFNTSASALKFYNGTQWNQITTFSGNYNDLTNTPTIPAAPAIEDNSGTPALATGITAAEIRTAIGAGTSSFDGAFSSLTGKPTTLSGYGITSPTIGEATLSHETDYTYRGLTITNTGDNNECTVDGKSSDGTQQFVVYGGAQAQGFLHPNTFGWKLKIPLSGSFTRDNTHTIWDSGNDGSGSGLDADKLDGVQGSNYLRSDVSDSAAAGLQVGTSNTLSSTGTFNLWRSSNPYIAWYSGGTTRGAYQQYIGSGDRMHFGDVATLESAGNVIAYASDERLKTDFAKVENALEKVCALEGVTYQWDKEKCQDVGFKAEWDKTEIGLRAQQVQEQFPQIVTAAPFDKDEEGNSKSGENYLTLNYERLVPVLIEAIKELKAEVEELKNGSPQ